MWTIEITHSTKKVVMGCDIHQHAQHTIDITNLPRRPKVGEFIVGTRAGGRLIAQQIIESPYSGIPCVRCQKHNTKCIDDMLQVGYVAEIYECKDCSGTIEVVYNSSVISRKNIKEYVYRTKGDSK